MKWLYFRPYILVLVQGAQILLMPATGWLRALSAPCLF